MELTAPIEHTERPVLDTFVAAAEAFGVPPGPERLAAFARLPEPLQERALDEFADHPVAVEEAGPRD